MFRLKPIALIATLGLACSTSAAYANMFNQSIDYLRVSIPNMRPGFEFSGAWLDLKPGATNLNYVIYNQELPAETPTWQENELRPAYNSAFNIGARYTFCGGKDIHMDWTHLNSTTDSYTNAPNANFFLGPDFEIGPAGLTTRNATGRAQFRYDVEHIDVGQYVDFGSHVRTRLFVGLSNANLNEYVTATYAGALLAGSAFPGPFSTEQRVISKFWGVGPRMGFDASYMSDCGLSFVGEGAASLLIGSSHSKTSYVSSSPELLALYGLTSNYQTIRDQSIVQVIPAFDAKLGVNYTHPFYNNTVASIEIGYTASVYVNAINQYVPGTLVVPSTTGGIFVATMNHTLSDYSVHGPYVEAILKV